VQLYIPLFRGSALMWGHYWWITSPVFRRFVPSYGLFLNALFSGHSTAIAGVLREMALAAVASFRLSGAQLFCDFLVVMLSSCFVRLRHPHWSRKPIHPPMRSLMITLLSAMEMLGEGAQGPLKSAFDSMDPQHLAMREFALKTVLGFAQSAPPWLARFLIDVLVFTGDNLRTSLFCDRPMRALVADMVKTLPYVQQRIGKSTPCLQQLCQQKERKLLEILIERGQVQDPAALLSFIQANVRGSKRWIVEMLERHKSVK
jgi:hypothetical protein